MGNYKSVEEITELLEKIVETTEVDRDGKKISIQDNLHEKEEWARHIKTLEDMLVEMYDKHPDFIFQYRREYEHLYNNK